jgi:squalene cyclase
MWQTTIHMTNEEATSVLHRGTAFLMQQQTPAGNFEGQLSSSTFPTCAYAWVLLAQDRLPDEALIDWLIKHQNPDGTWGLDAANQPNREATLFAQLILEQVWQRKPSPPIAGALARVPGYPLKLALIKLSYAAFGQFDWNQLTLPKYLLPVMTLTKKLLTRFPFLQSFLKPPTHLLPPVDLFNTPTFETLFIAEQHTLVPVFILIELNTSRRPEIINSLVSWLKEHKLSDNSWFRVNYITALSVLALIELQKSATNSHVALTPELLRLVQSEEIQRLIDGGIAWMQSTRNPDGGCREAVNLNIWDTALSVLTLTDIGNADTSHAARRASRWFIDNQNPDGGWAFSAMGGSGSLPSDADDTALATLALLRSKVPDGAEAIQRGLDWLKAHQSSDGSCSTYLPGQGDVGCVSITVHAIEAWCEVADMEVETNRACQWLESRISKEGYWSDLWLAKRTYGTACAIIGLIKAGRATSPAITHGVRWLESVQNSDGGWGEDMFGNLTDSTTEQTGWCTYALLLADRESSTARKGLEFLVSCQNTEGSWDASCVGIYWEIIGGYADPIYAAVFPLLALNQYLKEAK